MSVRVLREKDQWAAAAADAFKEAMQSSVEETRGVRVGWLFGFDAGKARIDKKLDYLEAMLRQHKAFSAVDLVKDIRIQIKEFGEKQVK